MQGLLKPFILRYPQFVPLSFSHKVLFHVNTFINDHSNEQANEHHKSIYLSTTNLR